MKKLLIVLAILGILLVVAVLGGFVLLGSLASSRYIPDTMAVRGDELPEHAIEMLQEEELLPAGETVQWLYSAGFLSYRSDGCFFTENRVVDYIEGADGVLDAWEYTWSQIAEIEMEEDESFLGDSTIELQLSDGASHFLFVSNDAEKDELFFEDLRRLWMLNRD